MLNRAQMLTSGQASYLVGKDLDAYVKKQRWQAVQEAGTGRTVFNPDDYLHEQNQFRVRDYELTAEEKVKYARIASRVRQ